MLRAALTSRSSIRAARLAWNGGGGRSQPGCDIAGNSGIADRLVMLVTKAVREPACRHRLAALDAVAGGVEQGLPKLIGQRDGACLCH